MYHWDLVGVFLGGFDFFPSQPRDDDLISSIWGEIAMRAICPGTECPGRYWSIIGGQNATLRATSHTRRKAHDLCNLRALIKRKGGDRPSSLHEGEGLKAQRRLHG